MNPRQSVGEAGATIRSRGAALVADDDRFHRLTLSALLKRLGFEVTQAETGGQAVEQFRRRRSDIVFMDVMMPEMDGIAATEQIKAAAGPDFVPVIFVTGQSEDDEIERCIAAGGDDFLTKPLRPTVLAAKINAMEHIRDLHRQASELNARLEHEQAVAEKVFSRVVSAANARPSALTWTITPAGVFSGDLLLAAYAPAGELHVLLGDFTGHGLAAALGAMPTAEIFRSMTAKGFAPPHILGEINRKLHALLPTGSFLAAQFVRVPPALDHITIANCGMPEALILNGDGSVRYAARSDALPLGVVAEAPQETVFHRIPVALDDRLLLASDGFFEASDRSGVPFGRERLDQALVAQGTPFENAMKALAAFRDGAEAVDDISVAEIHLVPQLFEGSKAPESPPFPVSATPQAGSVFGSRLCLELRGETLRRADPVPMMLSQLRELADLGEHRSALWTILAELYTNAVDHGVLRLGSDLKRDEEGFRRYVDERERRLAELRDGWVRLSLELDTDAAGGCVSLCVEDSGDGFDWRALGAMKSHVLHGRGLHLVASLCESLTFEGDGNRVRTRYAWRAPHVTETQRASRSRQDTDR